MNALIKPLHVEAMQNLRAELQASADQMEKRFRRHRMLEDEIVHHRPDYNEALELLDALRCALEERFNDNLPLDVYHSFQDLRKALDEADDLELRKTYDPRDQYAGPEQDFAYQPKD